jgi:hypothetical protein
MIDEFKAHVVRHKVVYLMGSYVTVAGITCLIMRGRISTLALRGVEESIVRYAALDIRPLSFFSKQTINIVSVIERDGRGHPGYLTKCIENGILFSTQGEAARSVGSNSTAMSRHLTGNLPHLNNHHFERISSIPI